ncbi:hypothetical protein M407DRAFT_182165 [Tulasnella calospora MUT 4182]|uniref:Uncharacterized protein n=1 Tax=Tulasnella calospora MUT 4182 TaxID=1051891 RepID=A0A0C3L3U4_9AGAM|nr:hypothetical protein M407DRAFT_182165 [Tulasnella calospora MUT 4182]
MRRSVSKLLSVARGLRLPFSSSNTPIRGGNVYGSGDVASQRNTLIGTTEETKFKNLSNQTLAVAKSTYELKASAVVLEEPETLDCAQSSKYSETKNRSFEHGISTRTTAMTWVERMY